MPTSAHRVGQPEAVPAPGPASVVVDPTPDPNLVRVTYSGVNAVCVGDHLTVTATGGNGNYTWSPNVGLSATAGASVVAGPLVTTTYTVTSTNPSTGAPTTATVVVNALENCCPQNRNRAYIKEVPGTLFDASTGSPFLTDPATGSPYPAGTRFHLAGAGPNSSAPIVLSGLAFQPPMGSVLLMDAGRDLYLQDGASLNLAGVSITAYCNDMWGKLWVRNSAAGLRSTFADGTAADPTLNTPPQPGLATLRNQLSHSLGGIEFEQPTPAVTNSAGNVNVPYCKLTATDFLHNEQSIVLHRSVYGENISGGVNYTYVSFSAFDSKPEYFKAPKLFAAGTPDYPHYSRYQALFTGFAGTWYNTTHQHTVFGFHCPDDGELAVVRVTNGSFSDCYLAGVNINATNPGGIQDRAVYVDGSTFVFPALLSLPTTPQFSNAIATDVFDHVSETRGVYVRNPLTSVANCNFLQPNDPYADFSFSERTSKQVGVRIRQIIAFNYNRLTLLHTGLQLDDPLLSVVPNGGSSLIVNNTFTACSKDIEIFGKGSPYPRVSLPLNCNTFDRVNATRPGTAYGIYLAANAEVTFDPIPQVASPPALMNKFLDYLTGTSGYYALYNIGATGVNYTTYGNYITANNVLNGHSRLELLKDGVSLTGKGNYVAGTACGTGNPGLERSANFAPTLEQNHPNPAADYTTFSYALSPGTTTAKLEISNGGYSGKVKTYSLDISQSQLTLNMQGWRQGVYFVSLFADGLLIKTRRLVVL
ncbi:hypothetical protein JAO73_09685 [Hymenobacter sp. BT523]|uniref:hypothetical protein n=1 Tax=Hymenobacter sp. BT523 TaxID=2795725 RepID=UPI0018EE3376|nr:hypothetical protein [Hymenobacter sp. BT523]MBJ6109283.1 hypothetical protein [Hymenobacter sp. BT523]